jgi:putative ATPase
VKDIRESIEIARTVRKEYNQKTILFVDEVHRFNKAQQDALLPHVENGTLTLIGATTENPYFEVNKALVSRSRIFQLKPLGEEHVRGVLLAALSDAERGYGALRVEMESEALDHIVRVASGDARSALNALELAVETTSPGDDGIARVNLEVAEESIQRRAVLYDKDGDSHYDTISAFIKSVRGSDADASLYWLSKMVYAGEDPRFIFRRMLILASEDVGLADPQALGVVSAAAAAFDYVGLPEGQFHLAQACLYLASAPKSNTTMAYYDALESVRSEQKDEVPDHLKDASRDGEDMGHGKGYLYPHAYRDHWVAQQYLPGSLQGKVFYQPTDSGYEATIRERVARNREAQLEAAELDRREAGGGTGSPAKPKAGKGYSSWLERAASQSGEILKQAREEIFRLSRVKRDSLVLDMGGGTGFLTWEACRRCPTGGTWTRCDDAERLQAMEEWARHLETLARPEFLTATVDDVPRALAARAEPPRFDAMIGLDMLRKTEKPVDTVVAVMAFASKGGRLIWSEANPARSQGFRELLRPERVGAELAAKVDALERAWRSSLPASPLEALRAEVSAVLSTASSASAAGKSNSPVTAFSASVVPRDFSAKKHFTPAQIRAWFGPQASGRAESLLARLSAELSVREKSLLEADLLDRFAGTGIEWRQAYDFLIVEPGS